MREALTATMASALVTVANNGGYVFRWPSNLWRPVPHGTPLTDDERFELATAGVAYTKSLDALMHRGWVEPAYETFERRGRSKKLHHEVAGFKITDNLLDLFDRACAQYGQALSTSSVDKGLAEALGEAADGLAKLLGIVDTGRDVALQSLHRRFLRLTGYLPGMSGAGSMGQPAGRLDSLMRLLG